MRAAARAALQPHLGAAMLAATAVGQAAFAHSPEHAARATGRGSRDRVSRSVGVADPGAASLVVEAMQRSAARRGKEPARGRGAAAAPARVARTGAKTGAKAPCTQGVKRVPPRANDEGLMPCGVCGEPVGSVHKCDVCGWSNHVFCGTQVGEEGYGQCVRCLVCKA